MTTGEQLQSGLARFFALKQQTGDARFKARLACFQRCQTERLRATHAALLADPKLRPALDFLLADIYNGADLAPVARDIQRALPYALKLLPDKVMATSAQALEAAILTQELDEAMTELLGDRLDAPLSEADYCIAYRALGKRAERKRQLELIGEFGQQLERYIRSRLLLKTFKMVRKPAHKAGFGHLYDFMARCFEVMQPVPDAGKLLAQISAQEAVIMQRLFDGNPAPFAATDRPAS